MTRCLILGCTQSKNSSEKPLPAIERYDGPTFRVLRKFLNEAPSALQDIELYVLSAQHGLISGAKQIENYDLRMTQEQADLLNKKVLERFSKVMAKPFAEVFVMLSGSYLQAMDGFAAFIPSGMPSTVVTTSSGKQLKALKSWLYKRPFPSLTQEPRAISVTGRAVVKGRLVQLPPQQVVQLAKQSLVKSSGEHANFRDWYALVDGERVSTKWLVSILTGLKVSEFQASDARRVLQQLGVEVYREA